MNSSSLFLNPTSVLLGGPEQSFYRMSRFRFVRLVPWNQIQVKAWIVSQADLGQKVHGTGAGPEPGHSSLEGMIPWGERGRGCECRWTVLSAERAELGKQGRTGWCGEAACIHTSRWVPSAPSAWAALWSRVGVTLTSTGLLCDPVSCLQW